MGGPLRRGNRRQAPHSRASRVEVNAPAPAPPRRGYLAQLLLSLDNCFRSHLVGYGGNGFAYIPTRFVPLLKEAGLSDEQIQVLLVENPRRVLTGEQ